MDIIEIEKNELRLNSGIAEENFGKMSYAQIIKEEGVLIKGTKTDNGYEFSYDSWTFDDVQAFGYEGKRNVFYCGKVPFFSKNVSTLLDALDSEKTFDAGFAFMQLLTDCAKQKREFTLIGVGGILIEFDKKENITILILPQSLFNYSIAGLSEKEKARLHNWWINPTLKGVQAYRFMRAVIAYKVLTGKVPYPATDIIERNADILDEKFLPLEYCINGIDLNFSDRITDELILNSASVTIPGKKQKKSIAEKLREDVKVELPKANDEKEKFFSESYFKAITDFPFDVFKKTAIENPAESLSDEVFEQRTKDFLKKQEKRVNTKRTFRRNLTKIIVITACSLLVIFFVGNTIKSNRENETTKGLTAEQTVEAYFKSMNTLNTTLASTVTKGRKASRYADIVSQIYVIGKNRQAYDRDEGFLNPAAYFVFTNEQKRIGKAGIYGVTNVKINGKECNIDIVPFTVKQKPNPITIEDGIEIHNKMEKSVQAEYFQLHTEGGDILIEHHNDIFTLTFSNERWFITDIELETEIVDIDEQALFEKYFTLLEENENNPLEALTTLKEEYIWLPKPEVILNEIIEQARKEAEFLASYGL